jgi:hypothetical protein
MVRHRRQHDRTGPYPVALAAFGVLLLACAPDAEGQNAIRRQSVGSLAGRVLAADGAPVSFALVRLPALGLERFTDASGQFDLGSIPSGAHKVLVSQTAFAPKDTVMWVDTTGISRPDIRLSRSVPTLSELVAEAAPPCMAPQETEAQATLPFTGLFDQVMQNAERFRVLSESYPFVTTYERVLTERRSDGSTVVVGTDTNVIRSAEVPRYAPGSLVRLVPRADREQDYSMRIPTLADLNNPAFRRSHCFTYAGIGDFAGERLARVDFRVADWVTTPDVDGIVYLDTATFQVRGMVLSLTRIPQRGIDSLIVTTLYRELGPRLAIPTQVSTTTYLRAPRVSFRSAGISGQTESQWLIHIGFMGRIPGSLIADGP